LLVAATPKSAFWGRSGGFVDHRSSFWTSGRVRTSESAFSGRTAEKRGNAPVENYVFLGFVGALYRHFLGIQGAVSSAK
jgi:hypothetical protein